MQQAPAPDSADSAPDSTIIATPVPEEPKGPTDEEINEKLAEQIAQLTAAVQEMDATLQQMVQACPLWNFVLINCGVILNEM